MSIYFVSTSFCELDPAVGDQAISIFGGHLDDAILSDRSALARPRLDRADPWRGLEADIDLRCRFPVSRRKVTRRNVYLRLIPVVLWRPVQPRPDPRLRLVL